MKRDKFNTRIANVLKPVELTGESVSNLQAHCLQASLSDEPEPRIMEDPTTHLTCEMGREIWRRELENPAFAKFIGHLLNLLLAQQRYHQHDIRRAYVFEALSRAARRFVLLVKSDPRNRDGQFRERLRNSDVLPPTVLTDTNPLMKLASTGQIEETLLWINRIDEQNLATRYRERQGGYDLSDLADKNVHPFLENDELSLRDPEESIEIEQEGRKPIVMHGKPGVQLQIDSAFTAMQSANSLIEPAAYFLLQGVETARSSVTGLSSLSISEIRFLLFATLEILHGIPAFDCADLGVNGHDGKVGRIVDSKLILNLAGGYYLAAVDAWQSKPLSLPLAQECQKLCNLLLERFPSATKLGDCREQGQNLKDSYRKQAKEFLCLVMPAYRGTAISLGKVWVKAARQSLHLPSSVVGLLRGNPLPGARGEAAYLTITYSVLVARLGEIQSYIRGKSRVQASQGV